MGGPVCLHRRPARLHAHSETTETSPTDCIFRHPAPEKSCAASLKDHGITGLPGHRRPSDDEGHGSQAVHRRQALSARVGETQTPASRSSSSPLDKPRLPRQGYPQWDRHPDGMPEGMTTNTPRRARKTADSRLHGEVASEGLVAGPLFRLSAPHDPAKKAATPVQERRRLRQATQDRRAVNWKTSSPPRRPARPQGIWRSSSASSATGP